MRANTGTSGHASDGGHTAEVLVEFGRYCGEVDARAERGIDRVPGVLIDRIRPDFGVRTAVDLDTRSSNGLNSAI